MSPQNNYRNVVLLSWLITAENRKICQNYHQLQKMRPVAAVRFVHPPRHRERERERERERGWGGGGCRQDHSAVPSGSGSVHCRDHFWPFLQWSWESAMQICNLYLKRIVCVVLHSLFQILKSWLKHSDGLCVWGSPL